MDTINNKPYVLVLILIAYLIYVSVNTNLPLTAIVLTWTYI